MVETIKTQDITLEDLKQALLNQAVTLYASDYSLYLDKTVEIKFKVKVTNASVFLKSLGIVHSKKNVLLSYLNSQADTISVLDLDDYILDKTDEYLAHHSPKLDGIKLIEHQAVEITEKEDLL